MTAVGPRLLLAALWPAVLAAGEVRVEAVELVPGGAGRYEVRVTLRHADEGWDHYADRWEVLSPDGEILATRVLLHPHVQEQPFTRALPGVAVPEGTDRVEVRGHDSVHGYGPGFPVRLQPGAGP